MATNDRDSISWVGLNIDELFKGLAALEKTEVLVGIPDGNTERKAGDPIGNAALGYIHENGSPAQNIPARPWLVPGILEEEDPICEQLKGAADAALDGDNREALRKLGNAGTLGRDAAKAKINSNIQPALAASTLAERKRRGIARTNTLVDTGALRNAINYAIKKGD